MKILDSVALVTGAASGFGREFTLNLLKGGGKVFAVDINRNLGETFEEECRIKFGDKKMKFMQCDVTDGKQLKDVFNHAVKSFDSLNIVCNNAGIVGPLHEMMENDPSNIHLIKKVLDIDLTAVVEGTYLGLNMMSKLNGHNGGVVINVASAAGLRLLPVAPIYTTAKHGVVAFTHCFKYLDNASNDGVRVNALCPAYVETPLITGNKSFHENLKKKVEFVDIGDVVKAFVRCIEDDTMNGEALAILPHGQIINAQLTPPNAKF